MSITRFQALETVQNRTPYQPNNNEESQPRANFGKYVFDKQTIQQYLDKETFQQLVKVMDEGGEITREIADRVATGMKNWATDKGATHYTHWFQPLNGLTAEKHDSFFDLDDGNVIEKFTGNALTQQEPDASSLPSGSLRNTFEARGYTAWDPSSPAFLMKTRAGLTLCIPTIFLAYTGEALDFKAPLLKALHSLKEAMVPVCQYFDENITNIHPTLGWEQEYFLVDAGLYDARPDLVLTNRTLFGKNSARDQQLEDHYFGSIPERAHAFMVSLEEEAHKLGIPLKTRHNEVGPSQYECAPLFEDVNLSVDHNQLLMDLIQKIARRHKLRAILHEKPFDSINGSGKHCNWSFMTNTGVNLLDPGKTSESKLQFLTFLVNIIKAVHDNADLLRASVASPGNDHRLGANEAPPAIISIFLGQDLTHVIEKLEGADNPADAEQQMEEIEKQLKVNIPQIPDLLLDNTDRNRTSPFAFTGNKFEFRGVGSSANTSSPMIVLNTILAHQLQYFKKDVDTLIGNGEDKKVAIVKKLQEYIKDSKNILFEGDNYSEEWVKEAEQRGLSNIPSTPKALDSYLSDKAKKLFEETGVLQSNELQARYEIMQDIYAKRIQIESRLLGDMAMNHVIPSAIEYQNKLINNQKGLHEIGLEEEGSMKENIKEISHHIKGIKDGVKNMVDERKKANALDSERERSIAYCDKVLPWFQTIRHHIDRLELNVDDKTWPLPKYREILFLR